MNDYSIPSFVYSAARELGVEVLSAHRVSGGVVADVWKIKYANDKYLTIRKTIRKDNQATQVVDLINNISNTEFVPLGFRAWSDSLNSYITTYEWVEGEVLSSFENTVNFYHSLALFHKPQIYYKSMMSIYQNIHHEAIELSNSMYKMNEFDDEERNSIIRACWKVTNELDCRKLNEILNNRKYLTHGDIKPANVVKTNYRLVLIDWDKICSLSPEADIIYMLFTGNFTAKTRDSLIKRFSLTVLNQAIYEYSKYFLPDMYLIHDVYVFLTTKKRIEYIHKQVLPLWKNWNE